MHFGSENEERIGKFGPMHSGWFFLNFELKFFFFHFLRLFLKCYKLQCLVVYFSVPSLSTDASKFHFQPETDLHIRDYRFDFVCRDRFAFRSFMAICIHMSHIISVDAFNSQLYCIIQTQRDAVTNLRFSFGWCDALPYVLYVRVGHWCR